MNDYETLDRKLPTEGMTTIFAFRCKLPAISFGSVERQGKKRTPLVEECAANVTPHSCPKRHFAKFTEMSRQYESGDNDPVDKILRLTLQTVCEELHCYGESYSLDGASSQKLVFLKCCASECENVSEDITVFVNQPNTESYVDGVGLPGNCKSHAAIAIQVLNNLVQNTHYYNAGGTRLMESAKLFHTVATVPLYSRSEMSEKSSSAFLGVLVLYFVNEPPYQDSLQEYLSSTALSVGASYSALCKSAEYRAKKRLNDTIQASRKMSASKIEASRKLSASKIDSYRNLEMAEVADAESKDNGAADEEEPPEYSSDKMVSQKAEQMEFSASVWLAQYLAKWKGGTPNFLAPLKNEYCAVAFLCCFVVFAVLQVIFDNINDSFVFRGKTNLFPLPPSFGALSTLVFALPAAPLGQPRIILQAHSLAMAVCVVLIHIFPQYHYVWLQKALAAAFTIAGMAKIGILNPPAGALCVALMQYYNSPQYSEAGLLFTFVSIYVCCVVIIFVAMLLHNVLKDRTYPICW